MSRPFFVYLASLVALAWVSISPVHGNGAGATAVLVVSGLGGDKEYEAAFSEQGRRIDEALQSLVRGEDSLSTWLSGPAATREAVMETLADPRYRDADRLVLVMLGHATHDGQHYRYNLPGPDLQDTDIGAMLAQQRAGEQIIIVSTPASGALLPMLSQPGRIVMTATRSAGEINAIRFSGMLAEALGSDRADIDRNDILTVGEVFRHATAATTESYELEKLIVSEHAQLQGDDAASRTLAWRGALAAAMDDPAVAELVAARERLEAEFEAIRAQKSERDAGDYYTDLKAILLRMARLQQRIDEATGHGYEKDG